MIRKENLEATLKAIGYIQSTRTNVFEKKYAQFDCTIEVDFNGNGSINYPEEKGMKITRKTTCNFSQPENFVVLECITRLMDKGYRPEHIELEKEWTLGHSDKGGLKYIPFDLHEQLSKRVAPAKNDILLAKNGTIGIAALNDTDEVFDVCSYQTRTIPRKTC